MKKTILLVMLICICMSGSIWAAVTGSHDPWDGTLWDITAPIEDIAFGYADKELRDLRIGIALRMNKEHETLATSSVGGEHIPGGGAILFYDTTTAVDANVSASTFVHDGLIYDTTLLQFFTMNAAEDTKVAITTGTAGIADANVTTAKIADANVTTAKIADANVTTAKIADANVTTAKIADANVTTAKIADANVTVAKLDFFSDEDSFETASDVNVSSSESIKAYVDLDSTGSVTHDAEGGFSNCDVDDTKTKVYTKYFTGTLDADSSTDVAHGITGIDNILSVSVLIFTSSTEVYKIGEMYLAAATTYGWDATVDGTNVTLGVVGSLSQGQKYRIKIDYIL